MGGNKRKGFVFRPRDGHLLLELASMRLMDREQAKSVAGFHSTTRANARLLALVNAGLLRRFLQGTMAGGRKALYTLSPKGAQYIGVQNNGLRHRSDELIVSNFFIAHQMAVNEVFCTLKYQVIPVKGARFIRWVAFSEPATPMVPLIPDGYFEVSTAQGVVAAFLEVDLGTEGAAVWKSKVRNYLRYATSGNFDKRFGQTQFRVLVVAHTERRAQALRKLVRTFTPKIFWFANLEVIRRDGFWGAVWQRPEEDDWKPLL